MKKLHALTLSALAAAPRVLGLPSRAFRRATAGLRRARRRAHSRAAGAGSPSPSTCPRCTFTAHCARRSISPQPESGDINSMDDVARSTWFSPRPLDIGTMARGPESSGPPLPPFTVIADPPMGLASGAFPFSIREGTGTRFVDPPDRPEMRTAALAVASRLFWALGYTTPPVFIIRARAEHFWRSEGATADAGAMLKSGAPPCSATIDSPRSRCRRGVWLGYAPESGLRGDDPNDVVPHENRRTLRALKVFGSWLALEGSVPPRRSIATSAPRRGARRPLRRGARRRARCREVVRVTDPPPAEGGGSPLHASSRSASIPTRAARRRSTCPRSASWIRTSRPTQLRSLGPVRTG